VGGAAAPRRARPVLRKAAQLWAEHAEEISWWNVREVGAIPGLAGFALHVAEQECWEGRGPAPASRTAR
jgi:benzaldehyde dehydrogenase (NAD)